MPRRWRSSRLSCGGRLAFYLSVIALSFSARGQLIRGLAAGRTSCVVLPQGGAMANDFQVLGGNAAALFSLKLHRGEGMCLVAMNWRNGKPPMDFVGFAIEYREPAGAEYFPVPNRVTFPGAAGDKSLSSKLAPIQKFRWVH